MGHYALLCWVKSLPPSCLINVASSPLSVSGPRTSYDVILLPRLVFGYAGAHLFALQVVVRKARAEGWCNDGQPSARDW